MCFFQVWCLFLCLHLLQDCKKKRLSEPFINSTPKRPIFAQKRGTIFRYFQAEQKANKHSGLCCLFLSHNRAFFDHFRPFYGPNLGIYSHWIMRLFQTTVLTCTLLLLSSEFPVTEAQMQKCKNLKTNLLAKEVTFLPHTGLFSVNFVSSIYKSR